MPRIRSAPEALRYYPVPADPNTPAFEPPTPPNRDKRGYWTVTSQTVAEWYPDNPQLFWGHGDADELIQMGLLWPTVSPMVSHPQLIVEITRRSVYVKLELHPESPPRRCAMLRPHMYHMSLVYVNSGFRFSLHQMHAVRVLVEVFARARHLHVDTTEPYVFWLGQVPQSNSWNFIMARQIDRDWVDALVVALQQQVLFPILGQPRAHGPRRIAYMQRLPLHICWL